jgi:sec-independent protein translocase protein TatC
MAEENTGEGSFISHLIELRDRLLRAIIAVLVVFAPLAWFRNELFEFIASPLKEHLVPGTNMIATELAAAFLTPVKLALWVSILITIPYLLYQLWAFVAPGLYRHERRAVWPLLTSSVVLFYLGMAFAYFVVFPLAFKFFVHTAPTGIEVTPDMRYYLDFVFSMFFGFGVAFEVPIAIVLLAHAGVVNPETLAKKRPYVVVWVFVIAMLLTPPDVISQTILAIPMLVLFEAGLFVARRVVKRKAEREAAEEDEYREMTESEMDTELDRQDDTPDQD